MSKREKFKQRIKEHDELENELMNKIRPFTDRKHLPDRRVSFSQIPCSFDVKTNIFIEDNSYDEYWRLYLEGEPMFIIYKNKNGDGEIYADWIFNIDFSGPFPPSKDSTWGDYYYRMDGASGLSNVKLKSATLSDSEVSRRLTQRFFISLRSIQNDKLKNDD